MDDHAEYIIGVFDNQKKLRSGTAQTVNYALHKGKVITLIHPDTMEITAPDLSSSLWRTSGCAAPIRQSSKASFTY